ncbi:unnamed protein product [Mucor hiemalis]
MARLSQICLATLALMIAVVSAAPCGHDHGLQEQAEHNGDVDHHTSQPDNELEMEWEMESGDDELDGDEFEVEYEDDCHTECYEVNDYDDEHNGNGDDHHGNGNGNHGNGDSDWDNDNGNHGNGDGHHGNGNGNHGNGDSDWDNGNGGNSGNDNGSGVGVGGGDESGDDSLVGVEAGYIGTGDINAQNALTDVVGLDDAHIHDLVQGSNIL